MKLGKKIHKLSLMKLTGFNVWQNQTHSTSKGGRIIGGFDDPTTVRSEINGIHTSSYLQKPKIHQFISHETHNIKLNKNYNYKQNNLLMASSNVDSSWSHWDSLTLLKNTRFLLAAETISTPSFMESISISCVSLVFIEVLDDLDILPSFKEKKTQEREERQKWF